MSYSVFLTPRATREVDEILDWISERSPRGAMTWAARWDEVIDELGQRPDTFGIAPEGRGSGAEIRHVIFKTRHGNPYRALFVVHKDQVWVIHVRGSGQDIVSLDELELPE